MKTLHFFRGGEKFNGFCICVGRQKGGGKLKIKKLFFTLIVIPVLLLGACSSDDSGDAVEDAGED